jgi:Susd and RagB outer membrane lipoprotein
MNIMKNKVFSLLKSVCLVSTLCVTLTYLPGCTKGFEERNTDPTRLTELTANDVLGFITTAEYSGLYGGWSYQTSQGLFADQYCQYFAGTQTAFDSHRYVIHQSWVQDQFSTIYTGTMPSLAAIIENTKGGKAPTLNAIGRIWKVFILHRTTDYYGPTPYSKIGIDSTSIAYDGQESIYNDFFKELTEAAADLKNNPNPPVSYGDKDKIYGGDVNQWLKFCNTLRLRLALRISKVNPAKAKSEAEAAVAGGVFTAASDDALFKVNQDQFNPFGIQAGWNEFRMSATMESVLKGYADPRIGKFFQPAVIGGGYEGLRNGLIPAEQNIVSNDYDHTSNVAVSLTPSENGKTDVGVMRAAEAYFLRAEGALNGWNMGGGTAQSYYEAGIKTSMESWGITSPAAIAAYTNGTSLPVAPGDYFNTPPLTDIPVKFSAVTEKQREQIATQKWLAIYPDGHEAWSEMRRSNYPKFYPLIHSDNPDVPANTMISRITFINADRTRNGAAVKAAESLLNGPDKASTPLWWDK